MQTLQKVDGVGGGGARIDPGFCSLLSLSSQEGLPLVKPTEKVAGGGGGEENVELETRSRAGERWQGLRARARPASEGKTSPRGCK